MGSNWIASGESGFKGTPVTVGAGNFALRANKYVQLKIFVIRVGFGVIVN